MCSKKVQTLNSSAFQADYWTCYSRWTVEEDDQTKSDSKSSPNENPTTQSSTVPMKTRNEKTSPSPSSAISPKAESIPEERHYSPQELEMETKMSDYFQMNCDLCLQQFGSWNDARSHYLDRHNVLKPFLRCCNRKFFLRSRIIEHIMWHVDPSAFKYVRRHLNQFDSLKYCCRNISVAQNVRRNSMRNARWMLII